jgi:hypothetical protein
VTRILDLYGHDLASLRGPDLVAAIKAAEGRTLLAEIVAPSPSLVDAVSNLELAAAFGADLVCLNKIDPRRALVSGLDAKGFGELARLFGRPVGLNLEPDIEGVPLDFRATSEAARAAEEDGAGFVFVTANPQRGATIDDLARATETVRTAAPDLLCLTGKMHAAGADEPLTEKTVETLLAAGAEGVLIPLPGTVPGITEDLAYDMVQIAQAAGALAVGTIGTSQEGADLDTVRALALAAKRIGVDVHHIGDAGYSSGIAPPENVYAYSVVIRGRRHSWARMATNIRVSWKKGGTDELS